MLIDLKGKIGLVVGIANEHSIAYGCAEKFRDKELKDQGLEDPTPIFI